MVINIFVVLLQKYTRLTLILNHCAKKSDCLILYLNPLLNNQCMDDDFYF